jgi:hypothetical protein
METISCLCTFNKNQDRGLTICCVTMKSVEGKYVQEMDARSRSTAGTRGPAHGAYTNTLLT